MNLQKPAPGSGRLERFVRRLERRQLKAHAVKAEKAAAQAAWKATRFAVYLRDRKRCRATKVPLLFETDNLLRQGHTHHIRHKSAGGTDATSNLVLLSPKAHRLHHDGRLDVTGDGDGLVVFTEWTYEGGTRTVLRTWESQA